MFTDHLILDLLLIASGLYGLIYVLGPLLLYFSWSMNRNFIMQEIDPTDLELPEEVREYFGQVFSELVPVGFRHRSVYLIPDLIDNTIAVFALYDNVKESCFAISVNMYASTGGSAIQDQHVQISGRDKQDVTYTVNNTNQPNAFAPVPNRNIYNFQNVIRADELFQLYRGVLQFEKVSLRPLPNTSEYEKLIRQNLESELLEQLGTGYLKLDQNESHFQMTIKGAILMTYKNLFPFTVFGRWKRQSEARSWKAKLNL